ncbi:MAG TPA: HlyD family efflux transporter periplasmic adaptor subunit [Burkholderiales bacterium]|jgi:putative peptide zinc metalloprotease protein|nr:HlyD family efflux transporter periplasmic adaptor subunit [Burkholderiales bacterium]
MAAPEIGPEERLAQLIRLRVRLRPHARVHRHEYRGRPWFVIEDRATGRAHRIDPAARAVLELLDGQRTLAEVHAEAGRHLGAEAPTLPELIGLVGTLYRSDLLTGDVLPDLEELAQRGERLRRARLRQYFMNPLSLRLPLLDPDRALAAAAGVLAPVPAALWVLVWLAAVLWGGAVAAQNWQELSGGFTDRIFSTENLFLLWFVYPAVKLLHEIGHGIALRRLGGQVHEMGLMFLVLIPVPYVEASAVAAIASKRSRMLVGAAGVLTELFLAGLAMIVWAAVEPGLVRAACFNVAVIAGVSTLVFNGNPLMRFDGYYVFSDWLEIPNLSQRAALHLGALVQRFAFGMRDAVSPAHSRGEARWLLAYGVASFAYRIFVSFSIILLVASKYFFAGVLLAIWGVGVMLLLPIVKGLTFIAASPGLAGRRRRAWSAVGVGLAAALLLLFVVPAPQWTRAEGVVWVPEDAQLRSPWGCWVRKVLAEPGARVQKGAPLVECEDPELATQVRVLEAQLLELRARDMAYFVESRLRLDIVREEIANTEARLVDARKRLQGLSLRSPVDGVFVMEQARDAPGRFAHRGELVAYVVEDGAATVRAVVDQDDIDLVRGATRSIALKPADRLEQTISARIRREVPGASDRLPSAALSVLGGGTFGVDPRGVSDADSAERPRVLSPVFQFDLEADPAVPLRELGMRVYVRFELEPAPIGAQAYRALRRLLLRRFEV